MTLSSEGPGTSLAQGSAAAARTPPPKDTDKISNSGDPSGLKSYLLDSFEPEGFSRHPWKMGWVGQPFAKQLTLNF